MKLIKTTNKTQLKISRKEWNDLGKKAGWFSGNDEYRHLSLKEIQKKSAELLKHYYRGSPQYDRSYKSITREEIRRTPGNLKSIWEEMFGSDPGSRYGFRFLLADIKTVSQSPEYIDMMKKQKFMRTKDQEFNQREQGAHEAAK